MKYALKVLGFEVLAFEREEDDLLKVISNSGGQFEICYADEDEDEYYEEEDQGFWFVTPR